MKNTFKTFIKSIPLIDILIVLLFSFGIHKYFTTDQMWSLGGSLFLFLVYFRALKQDIKDNFNTTKKNIRQLENYIDNSYRCKLEVTISIDWVELFSKINPDITKNEIYSIIELFRDDKSTLLSVNSITWLSEKDSMFGYNALKKTYHYADFTDKTIDSLGQGFSDRGLLFGYSYKNKDTESSIRSIFTNPDLQLEGSSSFGFGTFLITPERIGLPKDSDRSSDEIEEAFSDIPFQYLVDACIKDRKLGLYRPSLIESIKENFPDSNYSISVSDRPNTFDVKSGPVSLSVTINIYNACTPFETIN